MSATIPNTFSAGTAAEAAEVNENFQYIEDYFNNTVYTQADVDSLVAGFSKGRITSASLTSDSATFTTIADITSYTVTFTAEASRYYRLAIKAHIESSVAGDYARLAITTDGDTVLNDCKRELPVANESQSIECWVIVQPGAGSVTYKVRGERVSGTGNVKVDAAATSPALFLVEDLGT